MNERDRELVINRTLAGDRFTRRQYMIRKLVHGGTQFPTAAEAVTNASRNHPDWDMDEQRTWAEWEAALKGKER